MDFVVDIKNGGTGCTNSVDFANRLLNENKGFYVELDEAYLNAVGDVYTDLEKCAEDREITNTSIKWTVLNPPIGPVPFDLTNGGVITKVILFSATDYSDYSTGRVVEGLPVQDSKFKASSDISFIQNVYMGGTGFTDYLQSLRTEGKDLYAKYVAAYRPGV